MSEHENTSEHEEPNDSRTEDVAAAHSEQNGNAIPSGSPGASSSAEQLEARSESSGDAPGSDSVTPEAQTPETRAPEALSSEAPMPSSDAASSDAGSSDAERSVSAEAGPKELAAAEGTTAEPSERAPASEAPGESSSAQHAAEPLESTAAPASETGDTTTDTSATTSEESAPADESGDSHPEREKRGGSSRGGNRSWRPPRLGKEEMKAIWDEIAEHKKTGESLELEVMGHNRGGVVTQYKGVEVFIPMSHWSLERGAPDGSIDVKVGDKVSAFVLEVTDFETDARRVTGTRRALLRDGLLDSFQPGQRIHGKVTTLHDFGAFVDLGGIDGLVHASEISYLRNLRPSDVLQLGQEVEVVVKEVDAERERIYLGMKELQPSPWVGVEERYNVGDTYHGKVNGFTKTGAFVELEPGVEGFVRLRELSWTKRPQRPKEILRRGQEVDVRVLDISERKERLGLSYREALPNPWAEIAEKYAVGTSWEGTIRELSNKGVVLDVGDVEGFLPRGRMGREAKRLPDMNVGEKLAVNVIEVEPKKQSLILGLAGAEHAAGGRGRSGERPQGERGHGDRRDRRDRGPVAPVKPSNEIKEAGSVGSFSIGDMLGEAVKRQLGIAEEASASPKREEKPTKSFDETPPAPAEETPVASAQSASHPDVAPDATQPEPPDASSQPTAPEPSSAASSEMPDTPASAESTGEAPSDADASPAQGDAPTRDDDAGSDEENEKKEGGTATE